MDTQIKSSSILKLGYCLLILLLVGCSPSPGDVAISFYEELGKGEITSAKELATPATSAMVDMMVSMGGINDLSGSDIEVVDEKINGNEAVVTLRMKGEGKMDDKTTTVSLIKLDGDWKVNQSKN